MAKKRWSSPQEVVRCNVQENGGSQSRLRELPEALYELFYSTGNPTTRGSRRFVSESNCPIGQKRNQFIYRSTISPLRRFLTAER